MQGPWGKFGSDWEAISGKMAVVRLTIPLRLLIPALILPSLPKKTRGLTLFPGIAGMALGFAMVASSVALAVLLVGPTGPWGGVFSIWILGSIGIATMIGGFRPTAFVKPICVRCRLLPIIKEHESIHLTGVAMESEVWDSMRTRHSVESLGLISDPSICSFCPIPKRLSSQQG